MAKHILTRGICFDLDGTLIDSGVQGFAHFCKTARILNLPITDEIEANIRKVWGSHHSNIIKTCWPGTDIGKFYNEWAKLDMAEPFSVFPGVKAALEKLFKHFRLSILTSRDIKTMISQIEHNNLVKYFGIILAADSSLYKKPDPRSIDPILKWIRKDDLVFVGDTVEGDWKLARAVGLEFFAVLSGGMDTREKFLSAGVFEDHIIDSVADLPSILLNKSRGKE